MHQNFTLPQEHAQGSSINSLTKHGSHITAGGIPLVIKIGLICEVLVFAVPF